MDWMDTKQACGYTQRQLEAAFTQVQNAEHWKGPISAYIKPEDEELVRAAIIHFTATVPTFKVAKGRWPVALHVKAAGYWAGPAN